MSLLASYIFHLTYSAPSPRSLRRALPYSLLCCSFRHPLYRQLGIKPSAHQLNGRNKRTAVTVSNHRPRRTNAELYGRLGLQHLPAYTREQVQPLQWLGKRTTVAKEEVQASQEGHLVSRRREAGLLLGLLEGEEVGMAAGCGERSTFSSCT